MAAGSAGHGHRKLSPPPAREATRRRPRNLLFLVPSAITLCSIFCGLDAIRIGAAARSADDFHRAAWLILLAMLADALDGRVARMTGTQSAFGVQIDSLADLVSFGVAPAVLVYQWTLHRLGLLGVLGGFVFTACAAIRLARFNVLSAGEARRAAAPPRYIVGLPVTGAAGGLVALVLSHRPADGQIGGGVAPATLAAALFLSLLMVSAIRFRSFKDVRLDARSLACAALAAGASAVLSARWQPALVVVWPIGAYVALGVVESLYHLPARRRAALRGPASPGAPPAG
ncbi:CDP-diacylglycerol--serine O-phosphatidyltransferase [Sorangium cellulosum]|uniref:CDP-diacylglycerol--serine O-phosphatidyltransferase n=1 Tax=Sorangium cellulosum TaxID=56 RepID=UPI001F462D58|nr:CDP-diacylglycerol--serine O-phosphatidyltransferase [Sorangium cellulosum]